MGLLTTIMQQETDARLVLRLPLCGGQCFCFCAMEFESSGGETIREGSAADWGESCDAPCLLCFREMEPILCIILRLILI